ncbi:hypothetical protein RIF29_29786 [Crotalaria pallida]|uniref:Uncharacterized protein n=1 Tax=Crotalaria pallida TaxID=3830 RepID=A0AAN9HWI8_CROPI
MYPQNFLHYLFSLSHSHLLSRKQKQNHNKKMHTLFLLFSFFFFTSFSSQQLASSTPILSPINNRRILHEPFVPLDSFPPSETPLPPPILPSTTSTPNPKLPLSTTTTTTTPDQSPFSPFFPFYPYPSPPPPPPSFSTFASFPANISSLVIPHSPETNNSSSTKPLSLAIIAVVCATAMIAISALVYCGRKRHSVGNKTIRTESSLGLFPPNAETVNRNQRLRHTSSVSSELLYSRRVENVPDSGANDGSLEMESPELQPLPRLALRLPQQAHVNEEENEEFYSPKGSSLGGSGASESFGGNGLGSWRVLPAVTKENFSERCGGLSSSSCCSGSPVANLSPARAQVRSSSEEEGRSLPSTSLHSSPERNHHAASSFTEEEVRNEDALPRASNDSNGVRKSLAPSLSSAFSLPSSPEKAMHCDSLDQSPRISSFSNGYRLSGLSSVPLSPTLLSSPEREFFNHTWNESEKFTNWVPQRKQWEIPVLSMPVGPSHRVSLSLPSRLPPTQPTLPHPKQREVLARPPELTPPSRPFVLLKPATKVSPSELPLSSRNSGEY